MSCATIQHLIESYVDGAASPAERERVDAHVAHCSACAESLRQSRQLISLLGGHPERRVSPEFEGKLAAAVRAMAPTPAPQAWWERFRARFEWRLRVPALMAAGSLAAALVVSVATPQVVHYQEQQQERGRMVSVAVERHRQLERAEPKMDWDAVEASVDLSAGRVTD